MRPDRGAQYRFAVGIGPQVGDGVSHARVNDSNPCIKNGRDDLVLGTEMIVYATRLDPGGLGNFSERNGPVALFAEKPRGNVQHPVPSNRAARCLVDFDCRVLCHRLSYRPNA